MTQAQAEAAGERIRVGQDEIALRLTSAQTDGELVAADVTLPPGGGPPALHRHEAIEVYRVLEGELAFYFGDADAIERIPATAGAVVHVASGREHTIRNESDQTARGYVTFTNGVAAMEGFVRAAGALSERGTPALEDVLAVAAEHGVEITRPLPAEH